MGRPGLPKHRKFLRLQRLLEPACKAFAEQVARGALELLWDNAYENGDDYLGDPSDVEAAAKWKGKPGVLCKAFVDAGGEGEIGFIVEAADRPGHFLVHDLYDHAPGYVKKRMEKERERVEKGQTISDLRRAAANKRWMQRDAKENHLHPRRDAKGSTPAPSPSPAPSPVLLLAQSAESQPTAPESDFVAFVRSEWPDLKNPEAFERRSSAAHPGIDRTAEAKKARGWELSDVKRLKTRHGPFLWGWLGRAQDGASHGMQQLPMRQAAGHKNGGANLTFSESTKESFAVGGRKEI